MKKTTIYSFALFGLILCQQGIAQKTGAVHIQEKQDSKWINLKNEKGIQISYYEEELENSKTLYLSFQNTNKESVDVSWILRDQNEKVISENQHVKIAGGKTYRETELKRSLSIDQNPSEIFMTINFLNK